MRIGPCVGISGEYDFFQMHILKSVEQHGTVLLFQDIVSNFDDIVWPYADHETVKRCVVQFAEGNTVIHNGIAIGFSIRDDVRRVQQFKVFQAAESALLPIYMQHPLAKSALV